MAFFGLQWLSVLVGGGVEFLAKAVVVGGGVGFYTSFWKIILAV